MSYSVCVIFFSINFPTRNLSRRCLLLATGPNRKRAELVVVLAFLRPTDNMGCKSVQHRPRRSHPATNTLHTHTHTHTRPKLLREQAAHSPSRSRTTKTSPVFVHPFFSSRWLNRSKLPFLEDNEDHGKRCRRGRRRRRRQRR